jgi:NADH-quinone oxidoreductase subunit N
MKMPVGDLAPELALLLAAAALLATVSFLPHRRHGLAAPLALLGLALSAFFTVRQGDVPAQLTFHGTWALDGATAAARLIVLATTALAVALSPDWMRSDRRHGEYYALLLFAALGAVMLAGTADTLELVVAVLLSSVTGYTLAAYHRAWPLSVEAGMKYFLVGAFANTVLVLGVVLLYGLSGETGYAEVRRALAVGGDLVPSGALLPAVAAVVAGLAFKIAAFPAHAWLPDVAEGAPAPAAAFLTVAPKVGGLVALARFVDLLPPEAVPWRALVAVLALVTMTLGNLAALWQRDLRRLIGWSSVSQSGYALMAVVVLGASGEALPALLFFLLGYAVANLAAFAVVAELRGRTAIAGYAGLAAARPGAAAVLALAFLSLVGVPPLAGFVGKLGLFTAAIDGGYPWLAVAAVANTVVSLFYYLRVLGTVYFDAPAGEVATLGRWSRWTMLAAGALTVGAGLGAGWLLARLGGVALLP